MNKVTKGQVSKGTSFGQGIKALRLSYRQILAKHRGEERIAKDNDRLEEGRKLIKGVLFRENIEWIV